MKRINDFYNLSIEFSKYIQEQVISESSVDKLMIYLMRLYVAANELPNMEAETESNDDSEFCPTLSFSEVLRLFTGQYSTLSITIRKMKLFV